MMHSLNQLKQLADANKKKKESSEILQKKIHESRSKLKRNKIKTTKIKTDKKQKKAAEPIDENLKSTKKNTSPWGRLHSGDSKYQYFSRSNLEQVLQTQPWTNELVDLMLKSAEEGGINICLVWPAHFTGLALFHSLANIERNFARDLRGMKSLLYPGTHSTRLGLQSVLGSRVQLSNLLRSLWVIRESGTDIESHTRSASFEAMLSALNDIRIRHPEVDNPSLAELVPTFIYTSEHQDWVAASKTPLERSLKKVEKLAHRRNIRDKINSEWCDSMNAPGALMVLHRNTIKSDWKKALNSQIHGVGNKPEVFLLDATSAADQSNHNSVMHIPDFLKCAIENGYDKTGALIVADDPKLFFLLSARLKKLKLNHQTKIWAAEADDPILSANALSSNWKPNLKSNANFQVGIVDRDASQVALLFQRLAQKTGNEDNPSHQTIIKACLYILRLSNLPAGYSDLTDKISEMGGNDFVSHSTAWTPILLGLQGVLESGELNDCREDADKAISKAESLIDKWSDATPMAAKLLSEIKKHALKGRERLSIVLPSKNYINLAQRFLKRKLGELWTTAEERLDWHTLLTVNKTLTENCKARHFIFIGMNRNVMRLLITHPDVPHGTTILITYKQAESTLATLNSMIKVDAFKPYRGRMGLLAQQLDQRLKEIPNSLAISKLRERIMINQTHH